MANSCKECKHDKGKCVGASRAGSHRYCFEQKEMTNADRIRAMKDEELAKFLVALAFSRETPWADPFARKFCDNCPTVGCVVEEFGQEMEFNECEFSDGKCPHGDDVLWWLKEPLEDK